jgi:WhiB family transcriptional regulator, redox-sensing transcriptional regulator
MVAPMAVEWSTTWRFDAACRGEDSSLFFAPNYFERREEKDARERKAKAICARCIVRDDCLEYALRIRETHGVWGGCNEQERRVALRERDLRERTLQAG